MVADQQMAPVVLASENVPLTTHLLDDAEVMSFSEAAVPNCRLKIKVPKTHENGTRIGHARTLLKSSIRRVHHLRVRRPLARGGEVDRPQLN